MISLAVPQLLPHLINVQEEAPAMSLGSVVDIFEENVQGTAAITGPINAAPLLGINDDLVVQFHVANVSGTSPTITATYYHSNDGQNFVAHTTLLSAVSLSSPPYDNMVAVLGTTTPLGRYGRITVQLGGTTPAAYVRVVACGRVR